MENTTGTSPMPIFSVQTATSAGIGARTGILSLPGRSTIKTPHYVALTSRGAVPHIAQDRMRKITSIDGVYMGLEDFIEKSNHNAIPPLLKTPTPTSGGILSAFTALPENVVSILGPRRIPSIPCPGTNTNHSIAMMTSVGFGQLDVSKYVETTHRLQPDITVAIADLVSDSTPGRKRIDKSADRTHAWLRDTINSMHTGQPGRNLNLFAQILPYSKEAQQLYLQDLSEDFGEDVSGLALHDHLSIDCIPENLLEKPRLLLRNARTPHEILDAVALGVDLTTTSFTNESSDFGLAFRFVFGGQDVSEGVEQPEPLADDMWSAENATDISPLSKGCQCYACTRHHRAYLHHLLQAKEMLAWTLLQVHNHAMLDRFFESVRQSIAKNTFDKDIDLFKRRYNTEMPVKTGQGPRLRGYQFKSTGGGEGRKNAKAYGRLDDQAQKLAEAESGVPTPTEGSEALAESGFAEKTDSL